MNKNTGLNIVTRFAPSPTGYLHLGGARTALFNWMYSKKYSGKFLLRIENTDRDRSTDNAEKAILTGLKWLGLDWNDEVVYQFERKERHVEIINLLLKKELAYKCYSTKEEIEHFKKKSLKLGKSTKFISPWRNQKIINSKATEKYVVRLKVPTSGRTVLNDLIQGQVSWNNDNLDDLIILRSDGTATYNLAVVVDDFDFNITHVIRGDDHLTNAARQHLIYNALEWNSPIIAHIPLIHGPDGKKLSKRHGAVGLETYQKEGIKASAMIKYLSHLGWDSGSNDLISIEELVQKFTIEKIIKSPARFDSVKLNDISSKFIRNSTDSEIIKDFDEFLQVKDLNALNITEKNKLMSSLYFLKPRIKNYQDLYDQAQFLIIPNNKKIDENCYSLINKHSLSLLKELTIKLTNVRWDRENLNEILKLLAKQNQVSYKEIAQMVRIAILGKLNSPGIIDMMLVLKRSEVMLRFKRFYNDH